MHSGTEVRRITELSIFASLLRGAYKLSRAKKAFGLPEDEIMKVIEKQNKNRGVFTPTDHKAYYEMINVNGFECLIFRLLGRRSALRCIAGL